MTPINMKLLSLLASLTPDIKHQAASRLDSHIENHVLGNKTAIDSNTVGFTQVKGALLGLQTY